MELTQDEKELITNYRLLRASYKDTINSVTACLAQNELKELGKTLGFTVVTNKETKEAQ